MILFYTGGARYMSNGSSYTYSRSYDAYYYDLTESTYWHRFSGVHYAMDMEFVRTSPYEGFIFNWSPYPYWYIWNEYKFYFYRSKTERQSIRIGNTVAAIPNF